MKLSSPVCTLLHFTHVHSKVFFFPAFLLFSRPECHTCFFFSLEIVFGSQSDTKSLLELIEYRRYKSQKILLVCESEQDDHWGTSLVYWCNCVFECIMRYEVNCLNLNQKAENKKVAYDEDEDEWWWDRKWNVSELYKNLLLNASFIVSMPWLTIYNVCQSWQWKKNTVKSELCLNFWLLVLLTASTSGFPESLQRHVYASHAVWESGGKKKKQLTILILLSSS